MTRLIRYSSPNFDERDPSVPLQFIVLHYTNMRSGAEALKRLCDPRAKVSAHYVIEEDGRVFKLLEESKRGWHAGKSFWRGITDINSASFGIELVNPGHQNGYRAFPAAQMAACAEVMRDLINRYNLSATRAPLGHSDVAPGRKEDPGELFPWQALAAEGLGMWPEVEEDDHGHAEDKEVQELLRAIGYDCPDHGAYDRATRDALLAFQRHYHPENLTGTPEVETVARLRAMARICK